MRHEKPSEALIEWRAIACTKICEINLNYEHRPDKRKQIINALIDDIFQKKIILACTFYAPHVLYYIFSSFFRNAAEILG